MSECVDLIIRLIILTSDRITQLIDEFLNLKCLDNIPSSYNI